MKITRFEDVECWQLARELTKKIYAASGKDPFSHDFGLRDQIRKASGSVMHNIAEGFDSGSNREFIRFLRYARRSATEVQSELYVALDQQYVSVDKFQTLYEQTQFVRQKIGAFIAYLVKHVRSATQPRTED